jgi:peptide deformylase
MKRQNPKQKPRAHFQLVDPSNPILNKIAVDVAVDAVTAPETQAVIDDLLAIARGEQGDASRPTMVGLAAPQAGVGKRIIIVNIAADGLNNSSHEFRAYINPKVVQSSPETVLGREGCYSTGCVCGRVLRARQVRIEALDRQGWPVDKTYTNFPARILQHEIDHLDGIRFPDRIENDVDLLWVEKKDFGTFRHEWPSWSQVCPRQRWEAIKHGRQYQL